MTNRPYRQFVPILFLAISCTAAEESSLSTQDEASHMLRHRLDDFHCYQTEESNETGQVSTSHRALAIAESSNSLGNALGWWFNFEDENVKFIAASTNATVADIKVDGARPLDTAECAEVFKLATILLAKKRREPEEDDPPRNRHRLVSNSWSM